MEENLKTHVLSGCRVLLRPIVRLLLNSGVTWREFAEVAKTSFVEVASSEFGIRGRPTNVSRVTILTGINRHEVARQREMIATDTIDAVPTYAGGATRVLSGWHQDPDYLDEVGQPLEIRTLGDNPSFEDLCARYGGDIPPSAMLKELRAVGAVASGERAGLLRVLSRNYIPVMFDARKVMVGAELIEDHGNTVVYDLVRPADTPARLARRAHNPHIDVRNLKKFHEFIEREGQAFLERVDDWLTEHEVPADWRERAVIRLGAGIYHIQDESRKRTRE